MPGCVRCLPKYATEGYPINTNLTISLSFLKALLPKYFHTCEKKTHAANIKPKQSVKQIKCRSWNLRWFWFLIIYWDFLIRNEIGHELADFSFGISKHNSVLRQSLLLRTFLRSVIKWPLLDSVTYKHSKRLLLLEDNFEALFCKQPILKFAIDPSCINTGRPERTELDPMHFTWGNIGSIDTPLKFMFVKFTA